MNEHHTPGEAASPPRRSRTRMALFGAALLLCGAIIGAGGMATVLWERFQHSVRDPKRMPERIVDGMREGLKLTDAQARQIEDILARHRDEFDAIRREMEPRIQAHMDQVDAEIKEVLTEEQRQEWERRFVRERRRWSRLPGSWGHRGGSHDRPPETFPGGEMPPPPPPGPFPGGGE